MRLAPRENSSHIPCFSSVIFPWPLSKVCVCVCARAFKIKIEFYIIPMGLNRSLFIYKKVRFLGLVSIQNNDFLPLSLPPLEVQMGDTSLKAKEEVLCNGQSKELGFLVNLVSIPNTSRGWLS